MAQIEMNALSVITCGSFSARIFLPEMDKLMLNDKDHQKKYPVLWLLHDEGGAALDWLATPAERLAARYGIFIIAPDQHHAMCTDMTFGPRYEHFMASELPGICRNNLPISPNPKDNWIGGVGTGGYGAVKMALKHPNVFSKAFAIHGILDMERLIRLARAGEDTGTCQNLASLKAVFGDPDAFSGSGNDLYALARQPAAAGFCFLAEEGTLPWEESSRLAALLNGTADLIPVNEESDFSSCQCSLPQAFCWLMK